MRLSSSEGKSGLEASRDNRSRRIISSKQIGNDV